MGILETALYSGEPLRHRKFSFYRNILSINHHAAQNLIDALFHNYWKPFKYVLGEINVFIYHTVNHIPLLRMKISRLDTRFWIYCIFELGRKPVCDNLTSTINRNLVRQFIPINEKLNFKKIYYTNATGSLKPTFDILFVIQTRFANN